MVQLPESATALLGQQSNPQPNQGDQSASILQVISVAASNLIRQFLYLRGYVTPDDSGRSIVDIVRDREKQTQLLKIMFSGEDAPHLGKLVDGVLYAAGVDPQKVPIADKVKLFITNYPIFSGLVYFILGEDTYDQLFGQAGSQALLAKSIFEAYGPKMIDGVSAMRLATNLHMAFESNPGLKMGFHGQELAEVLKAAVKSGLLTPTSDGNLFIRQFANVVRIFAAARDGISRLTGKKPSIDEVSSLIPEIVSKYSGIPIERVGEYLRRDIYVSSIAPHGLFQAGVIRSGVQTSIAPEIYTKDDVTLRNKILDSPVGNMVGATIRAVSAYGARGPLGKFYKDIMSGNMPVILPSQWLSLAVRSGIPPHVAAALLVQTERNKSFLTPEVIQTLRASQFKYDIAPVLDMISMQYRDPELRAGAIAEFAKKMGYKSVGMVDAGSYMLFLHSNHIHAGIKDVLDRAKREAAIEESMSMYQGLTPPRSITQHIMDVAKQRQTGQPAQISIPGLFGAVKFEDIKEKLPKPFVHSPDQQADLRLGKLFGG